jgi:protocatechuate 3,4-dioxygenase beta subunit
MFDFKWSKRNNRKSLSSLLIVLILLSMLPAGALASASAPLDGAVSGKVTDVYGNPVVNADISLWNPDDSTGGWGQTDENGDYIIEGLLPGTYIMNIYPLGFDLMGAEIPGIVVNAGKTTIRDVVLEQRGKGSVAGKVTDSQGTPVEGANIFLFAHPHMGEGEGFRETQTDVNGNYVIDDLWAGSYHMIVTPPVGSKLIERHIPDIVVSTAATLIKDVILEYGDVVAGTVRDSAGKPVAGATISLWDPETHVSASARTDAEGKYTSTGLPPGTYNMNVIPPPGSNLLWVQFTGVVVIAGETTNRDVVLEQGAMVTGKVTDPAGKPVANASISLWDPVTFASGSALTDADGIYTASALRSGTYNMAIMPPFGLGLPIVTIRGIVATAGATITQNVVLRLSGNITGNVVDFESNPVAGAAISVIDPITSASVLTHTDQQGNFTLANLALGRYDMTVTPPAGVYLTQETVTGIDVIAGETANRNVTLRRSGTVAGQVTDPNGRPVADILIRLRNLATMTIVHVNTDEHGNYVAAGLLPGDYEMRVSIPPGIALGPTMFPSVIVNAGQKTTWNVGLEFIGIVRGRIADTLGNAVPFAWIHLYNLLEGRNFSTQADMGGNYTLAFVPPGSYDMTVTPPDWLNLAPAGFSGIEVTLGDITTKNVELKKGATVTGKVTDKIGNAVANAQIVLWDPVTQAGGAAQTNAQGYFTIERLPAGTYEMRVTPPAGFNLAPATFSDIFVAVGATINKNISLQQGGLLTGRVTDFEGKAVAGAQIHVMLDTQVIRETMTNAQGDYTVVGLLPDSYGMKVAPPYGSNLLPKLISEITVALGETTTRNVDLEQGGIVAVIVTDPEGNPVAGALINVRDPFTGASVSVETGAEGNYTLSGLLPGTYDVTVTPPVGFNLALARFPGINVARGETTTLPVALKKGGTIEGKVMDSAGTPLAEVNVKAIEADTGISSWVQTDVYGRYSLTGLFSGTYELTIKPPAELNLLTARIAEVVVTAGETTIIADVELVQAGILEGKVTDAESKPVKGAEIRLWGDTGESYTTVTGPEGNYRVIGLMPGIYELVVTPPNELEFLLSVRRSGIIVGVGATVTRDIQLLERGGIAIGRVKDYKEAPVANAHVSFRDHLHRIIEWTWTNAEGEYVSPALVPATYEIAVTPPDGTDLLSSLISGIVVSVGKKTTVPDAVLEQGGRIAGRVTDIAENQVAHAHVHFFDTARRVSSWARTNAAGYFTSNGLLPGTYEITVTPPPGANLLPGHIADIVVKVGYTTNQDMVLETINGGVIMGRVTDFNGRPVANAHISLWSPHAGTFRHVNTNWQGNFNVAGLLPGTYSMTVTRPFGTNLLSARVTDIVVTAGEIETQNVVLARGGILTGQVEDYLGNALGYVQISVRDLHTSATYSTWTDYLGYYTIIGLSTGNHEMTLRPVLWPNLAVTRIPAIAVTAGETTIWDVVLEQGGFVSGTVKDADNNPVANAVVLLEDPVTWISVSVLTEADGSYTVSGLLPGFYDVTVTPPAELNLTTAELHGKEVVAGQTREIHIVLQQAGEIPIDVTGVTVTPGEASLNVGDSLLLSATVEPEDATSKDVAWSSDDETVATVDGNGLVTAVGVGTATITVTTADGGHTATSAITVVALPEPPAPPIDVTGVTVTPGEASLNVGDSLLLSATVKPEDATSKDVAWSSDDETVATVDGNGLVTAHSAGTATITVTTADGGHTATSAITVVALPEPPAPPAPVYGDPDGDGQVTNADATQVLRAAVRIIDLSGLLEAADVNGDGRITAADATLILRRAAGLIDRFPVEPAD